MSERKVFVAVREHGDWEDEPREAADVSVFATEELAVRFCEACTSGWMRQEQWRWRRENADGWDTMRIFQREVREEVRQCLPLG